MDISEVLEAINRGEEPMIFKVCTNKATPQEIDDWLLELNVAKEDQKEFLSMVSSSYSNGEKIATINLNNNDDDIMTKLNTIEAKVDKLQSDLSILINKIKDT